MLSCLRDTRTSIEGAETQVSDPANLKASLADKALTRHGLSQESGISPAGFFCLKSGGTSE
jgi:hypothetical protein